MKRMLFNATQAEELISSFQNLMFVINIFTEIYYPPKYLLTMTRNHQHQEISIS